MPDPHLIQLGQQAASQHNIPWWLFNAQINQESRWNPQAESPVGATGLGQLMPATAQELGVTNPTDPAQNLDASAKYLQNLHDQFGNWRDALAAYNAGPGAVQKYGGVPPYQETQNYVNTIMLAAPQGQVPAGGGVSSAPASDTETLPQASSAPAKPGLGLSLSSLLSFAAPSPTAVGILGRLGGTAGKIASNAEEPILPPDERKIGEIPSSSSDFPVVQVKVDHSEPIAPETVNVIRQAEQYLGTPYLWGGADPRKGFDCSGFVQYLYAQQGIALPRTTYKQVKVGQAVKDPSKLEPGDIVFFSQKGDIHHEGLYIGNGQFIHAPHTGDVVKISSLNEPYYKQQFFVGRRISPKGAQ